MAVFCSSSSTQDKGAGVGDGTAHLRIHELNELLNMMVALLVPNKEDHRQGWGGEELHLPAPCIEWSISVNAHLQRDGRGGRVRWG